MAVLLRAVLAVAELEVTGADGVDFAVDEAVLLAGAARVLMAEERVEDVELVTELARVEEEEAAVEVAERLDVVKDDASAALTFGLSEAVREVLAVALVVVVAVVLDDVERVAVLFAVVLRVLVTSFVAADVPLLLLAAGMVATLPGMAVLCCVGSICRTASCD